MNDLKQYKISITGIVQGVGMRPHIYRVAKQLGLGGWVSNHGTAVIMEIAGDKKVIKEFLKSIIKNPPKGAEIDKIRITLEAYKSYTTFSITESSSEDTYAGVIPPDTAVCEECLKEMNNTLSRRYKYPFTNCSSCGPRYSVIRVLPYDRSNTTMSDFDLCDKCKKEYENPENRRFHAQTNCCPDCGPRLTLLNNNGTIFETNDTVNSVIQLLSEGKLIGIKGIGGYHIACNATDEKAIELLRNRKRRPDKPLAIMAADIECTKLICNVNYKEEEILTGLKHPIVLMEKKLPELLPPSIAPGVNRIGVMLPYTPLHHLLFQKDLKYLVMTSGNISGAPICYRDNDVIDKLSGIADFFFVHNREIISPIEDSVIRVIEDKEMVSRVGRGYSSNNFNIYSKKDIIALGTDQKSSVCLLHKNHTHSTPYLGNLEYMGVFDEYINAIDRLTSLFNSEPSVAVHDLHPAYISTKYALKINKDKFSVQHHHAHMASCMAEHRIENEVIGVIYDGTGMGTDGAIWGGEFFIGSIEKFKRIGHLKYVNIQGGDIAVKEPYRTAISYLYSIGIYSEQYVSGVEVSKIKAIQSAISNNINCYQSSSMGRLFDCISALVLKRIRITYDAQAAIELECIIDPSIKEFYVYSITESSDNFEIEYEEILNGVLKDINYGKASSYISTKFHNTICTATIDTVSRIRSRFGINDVVMSGGVFENTYLLENINKGLMERNFKTYHNLSVPVNDGGIALGQAAVAAMVIKGEI